MGSRGLPKVPETHLLPPQQWPGSKRSCGRQPCNPGASQVRVPVSPCTLSCPGQQPPSQHFLQPPTLGAGVSPPHTPGLSTPIGTGEQGPGASVSPGGPGGGGAFTECRSTGWPWGLVGDHRLRTWGFLLAAVLWATGQPLGQLVHREPRALCQLGWPWRLRTKVPSARGSFPEPGLGLASEGPTLASSQHRVRVGRVCPLHQLTTGVAGGAGPTWAAMPPRPSVSPPLLACVPVVHVMDS